MSCLGWWGLHYNTMRRSEAKCRGVENVKATREDKTQKKAVMASSLQPAPVAGGGAEPLRG